MSKIIQNEVDSLVLTTRYVRGQLATLAASYLRMCSEEGLAPKGDLVATLGDVLDLSMALSAKTGKAETGYGADALLASEQVARSLELAERARKSLGGLRAAVRGACGVASSNAVFGRGAIPNGVTPILRYVERARTALDNPALDWTPAVGVTIDKAQIATQLDGLQAELAASREANRSRKQRARETRLVRNQNAEALHRAAVSVRALAESLFVLVGDDERAGVLRQHHAKRTAKEVEPTPMPPVLPPAPRPA